MAFGCTEKWGSPQEQTKIGELFVPLVCKLHLLGEHTGLYIPEIWMWPLRGSGRIWRTYKELMSLFMSMSKSECIAFRAVKEFSDLGCETLRTLPCNLIMKCTYCRICYSGRVALPLVISDLGLAGYASVLFLYCLLVLMISLLC